LWREVLELYFEEREEKLNLFDGGFDLPNNSWIKVLILQPKCFKSLRA
jgi:hypothetical protein